MSDSTPSFRDLLSRFKTERGASVRQIRSLSHAAQTPSEKRIAARVLTRLIERYIDWAVQEIGRRELPEGRCAWRRFGYRKEVHPAEAAARELCRLSLTPKIHSKERLAGFLGSQARRLIEAFRARTEISPGQDDVYLVGKLLGAASSLKCRPRMLVSVFRAAYALNCAELSRLASLAARDLGTHCAHLAEELTKLLLNHGGQTADGPLCPTAYRALAAGGKRSFVAVLRACRSELGKGKKADQHSERLLEALRAILETLGRVPKNTGPQLRRTLLLAAASDGYWARKQVSLIIVQFGQLIF